MDSSTEKIQFKIFPYCLSVILDGAKRLPVETKNLVTLIGVIGEHSSILIKDAFESAITQENNTLILNPNHYSDLVTMTCRLRSRCFIVGWASTNFTDDEIINFLTWAEQKPRLSYFTSQKNLATPIFFKVTPPSATSDLSVNAVKLVDGNKLTPVLFKFKSLIPFEKTDNSNLNKIFELCKERVEKASELVNAASQTNNYELARSISQAIAVNLDENLHEFVSAETEDRQLFSCLQYLFTIVLSFYLRLPKDQKTKK